MIASWSFPVFVLLLWLIAVQEALAVARISADPSGLGESPVSLAIAWSTTESGHARAPASLQARADTLRQTGEPTISAASLESGALRLAAAGAGALPIAVIYPDIGEPYRSVFSKIIEGIEDRAKSRVTSFAVGDEFNARQLSDDLKKQEVKVVIALGRNGHKAAMSLDKSINVVTGGVISIPESEAQATTVLSLAPDPALIFGRLKMISPNTRRVTVVFDPRQNAWLMRAAREAARAAGLELMALEASDLRAAVKHYQDFFADADGKRDALWLLQDVTTADETTVLPLVLQESWNRHVPVFSSSVAHVRRGALFALYPNNMGLGQSLASSALGAVAGLPPTRGMFPLRDVLTAFNTRTASHLGLARGSQLPPFDLVFPEP